MPVGLSDGTSYNDSADWFAASVGGQTDKQRSDQAEINQNSTAGDFQSRFYATDASTMPLQASTELAGALKSYGSTGTPANRSVLEKLTGSDGRERFQTWPERLARSAFTLPGDVLSGKVQPGSIQEIERAADLASIMVSGPAPVAAKLADGSLGSFAGVKSRTLPKDRLYEAQNMELDAYHPDDIWDKTEFFRGADTRWRYEISDKDAKLKESGFDWDHSDPQGRNDYIKVSPKTNTTDFFGSKKNPLTLDKVMDHPELFKAYPELGTMKVEPLPAYLEKSGVKGQVSGDTIYLAEGHPEYIRSVLLHEIQHGIQHHEGFAFGGSQEQFLPKELPQAEKEFLAIKQAEEPKIAEAMGSETALKSFKQAINAEQEGWLSQPEFKTAKEQVDRLRNEHPEVYRKLSNIVKSENLLKQTRDEAFVKYQRLMGEVEARNVQARLVSKGPYDYTGLPPFRTEDTPRHLQINSNDKSVSMSLPEHVGDAAIEINGKLYTGPSHYEALKKYLDSINSEISWADAETKEGFLTSSGRFVDRHEALEIASRSGQFDKSHVVPGAGLHSPQIK